jgi:hypothetical protein
MLTGAPMSILNFTADDLKQINSRAIERLRSQVPEKNGSVVIISPSSTAANFSKERIRHFFKVAKKKLSETE